AKARHGGQEHSPHQLARRGRGPGGRFGRSVFLVAAAVSAIFPFRSSSLDWHRDGRHYYDASHHAGCSVAVGAANQIAPCLPKKKKCWLASCMPPSTPR
nr:hypothetical protein [Tanacetum cinerariifolium]